MQVWYWRMIYDGRFVVGDDLFHRLAEIAGLVALASTIVHIRPASILSNASDNVDMFAFCLSLTSCQFLMLLRFVELYFWGIGEGTVLKSMAVKEGMIVSVIFFLTLAASVVAGVEFYGNDDEDNHRMLAEAATATPSSVETTNVPIWLCLMSFVSFNLITTLRLVFLMPSDGSHTKQSKFFFFVARCRRRPPPLYISLS
jgi:hypothetical protein